MQFVSPQGDDLKLLESQESLLKSDENDIAYHLENYCFRILVTLLCTDLRNVMLARSLHCL